MKDDLKARIERWGNTALTAMLLTVAAALIAIALLPKHHIEKAIALAWVLLP